MDKMDWTLWKPPEGTLRPKRYFRIFTRPAGFDKIFFIALIVVLVAGLLSLFSASYAYSYYQNNGDSYHYISRQLFFAGLGLVVMFAVTFVDYHFLHYAAIPFMIFAGLMLGIVLLLPEIQNVHRWIRIGPLNIQPSEIAKFAIILLFAHLISHFQDTMKYARRGFWPFIIVLGATCALVFVEPHLSGTMLILLIGMVMMFVGGTRWYWFVGIAALGAFAVLMMVGVLGYEQDRIEVWLDPLKVYTSDKIYDGGRTGRDVAWQTVQSLYAIGSGGLMGEGLGQSRQKHLFLPEPQNDFIFAIVCEELGFIGAVIIILLFAFLLWRGFVIGMRAPDKFGSMLAIGLTAQIGLQVVLNLAAMLQEMKNERN